MRRLMWSAAIVGIALSVSGVCRAGDQEVAEEIKYNLKEVLRNYNVGIKVQDGTAWLNGSVADERQMAAAMAIARQTPGVERVVNNMAIGSQSFGGRASASNLQQPTNIATSIRGGIQPGYDNFQPSPYQAAPMQPAASCKRRWNCRSTLNRNCAWADRRRRWPTTQGGPANGGRSAYAGRQAQPRNFAGRADGYPNYPPGGVYPQGNQGWGPVDQGYASGNAGYGQADANYVPSNVAPQRARR